MTLTSQQKIFLGERNLQIGNICFQWANWEYQIAIAIWSMLHLDVDTGKIVTGGLDIRPRLNMAINLSKELQAPKGVEIALLASRTALDKGLDERRNKAIHGHRMFDPNDPASELVEVHRGKGDRKRSPQTNADLRKLGKDIAEASNNLHSALLAFGVFHAPLFRPARVIAPNTSHSVSVSESKPFK